MFFWWAKSELHFFVIHFNKKYLLVSHFKNKEKENQTKFWKFIDLSDDNELIASIKEDRLKSLNDYYGRTSTVFYKIK